MGDLKRCWAILAACVLVLSACGDDTEDAAEQGSPTTDASTATDGSDAEGSSDGGSGGESERAGEVVRIGFVNSEHGPVTFPEVGRAAEAAVELINETGGINGASLELVICHTDVAPESSVDCANRMVEAGVPLVVQGFNVSGDATMPIFHEAGLPLAGPVPFGPMQMQSDTTFLFGPAQGAIGALPLEILQSEGAEAVTFVANNRPVGDIITAAAEQASEALDLQLRTVRYDSESVDWNASVASATSGGTEGLATVAAEPDCIGMATAIRQANFQGPVVLGACTVFIPVLGDLADGFMTIDYHHNPLLPDTVPADRADDVTSYIETMEAAGHAEDIEAGRMGFSTIMNVARVLETIEGDITPESVIDAFRSAREVPSFMGATFTCDGEQWPGEPSACSAWGMAFRIESGVRQPVGEFIDARQLID